MNPDEMAASALAEREAKLKQLRAPFPDKAYGKLFKAYNKEESKRAPKATCRECGSYHSTAKGVHLDYIGHAAVRDRLLTVDLEWNWEPMAWQENGLPLFVLSQAGYPIGLWIKLTVCGVTRPGVGSVAGDAFDPEKQLIGDALRNAAMSFGVGLDLWSKEELESEIDREDVSAVRKEKREAKPHASAVPPRTHLDRTTGELTPAGPSPEEEERLRREEAEAFGGGAKEARTFAPQGPGSALPDLHEYDPDAYEETPAVREVFGIPITLGLTFASIAQQKVGGNKAHKNKTWEQMAAASPGSSEESTLLTAREMASDAYADGKDPSVLAQCALLALEESQRRRMLGSSLMRGAGTAIDLIEPAKEA